MEGSPLDLVNSDVFRKKLITRNLTPYAKAPNRPTLPVNTEYIQTDSSVQDSPDQLIDEPSLANQLYPLNQYGAEGGYKQVPDPTALLNSKSNEGEYGFQDANIVEEGYLESENWRPRNAYGTGVLGVLDSAEYFGEPDWIRSGALNLYNNQPYPTTFVPSSYSPVSILLSPDPIGNNGLLSQDSYIAQLGAQRLRRGFEERIATNIRQQTVDRANIFNVDSGTDILNLLTTRVPLIEPNWTITVPANPILAATDFALRLAGSILPVSPIPGSYFDTSIVLGQPTTIQQIQNAFRQSNTGVGRFFSRLLGTTQTGSQLFLNNTGGGQKSRLFGNLRFNRYKPGYDRNIFDRLAGVIVGTTENNSNYYVGSPTSEPSMVFSPSSDIPVNDFGVQIQAPVYGPSELAQLYEGPNREIRLGANAPAFTDGGGIEGGLTWVSPKYKGNAGKKVGVGGEITNPDENFRPSSFNKTESTNIEFRTGSIMDDTQRIIDSQPNGGRRLKHVGNAIDQVSKVFNDGYKELTKGSRVLTYVGSLGQEVGTEYCRVFAKDLPYIDYSDLQKTDGVVDNGRRFAASVFNKTFNLNMYPNKQEGGQGSSNLVNGRAEKYMFSLENLAWRTSNTPGLTVNDLPVCERGPNGGRVMWFPPYDLKFNENTRASWKTQDFLGRPEPVYTYTNSSRDGQISWKIVVDHPSILNAIVDKVLANTTNSERINGLLESFFAGCKKYDIYELAKKYYTIPPSEIQLIQDAIASKETTREQTAAIRDNQQSGGLSQGQGNKITTQPVQSTPSDTLKQFENFALFFANAEPFTSDDPVEDYSYYYGNYLLQENSVYKDEKNFFDTVIKENFNKINGTQKPDSFIESLNQYLSQNPNSKVNIELVGSASSVGNEKYNLSLSARRIQSVIKYFNTTKLKNFIDSQRITFKETPLGENAQVQQLVDGQFRNNTESFNCSQEIDNQNAKITSKAAMACRRVLIKTITTSSPQQEQKPPQPNQPTNSGLPSTNQQKPIPKPDLEPKVRKTDWVTKRIVRAFLSECDYFEQIKEESPMLYENLKQKLKFFQPAFHSTTPEGLNSRLTFLQQCMRPGDTIPTVKPVEGGGIELDFNNAINTAFGVPPVLVMRIGDFYHTKIIPTNLQLQFEGLDINPEGIGIQPMIANVTLSFNFVGGQGLKTAVDKLQNALTFNYYANTEMYDERADVTDTSFEVFSKDFLQSFPTPSGPTTNQVQNLAGLTNSTTIGSQLTNVITTSGETGIMSYTSFMDNFVAQTQNYFRNVFNISRSVFDQYNNAILQYWSIKNLYQNGKFLVDQATEGKLYGKNDNYQKNMDRLIKDLVNDIESNNDSKQDRFIYFINKQNFSKKAIRIITDNYKTFVQNKKGTFPNAIAKLIQDTTNTQTVFLQYISRTNVVPFQVAPNLGTDGFQEKNGNIKIFDLKGDAAVMTKISDDIKKIRDELNLFDVELKKKQTFSVGNTQYSGYLVYSEPNSDPETLLKEVFYPFSSNNYFKTYESFRRQYAVLSNDVKGPSYQTFKNFVVGGLIANPSLAGSNSETNFGQVFDAYWLGEAKPAFDEENQLTKTFLDTLETSGFKNFLNFTPFPLGVKREFEYVKNTNPNKDQEKLIKALGAQRNSNNNKSTWNTQDGTNVFISKVNFN